MKNICNSQSLQFHSQFKGRANQVHILHIYAAHYTINVMLKNYWIVFRANGQYTCYNKPKKQYKCRLFMTYLNFKSIKASLYEIYAFLFCVKIYRSFVAGKNLTHFYACYLYISHFLNSNNSSNDLTNHIANIQEKLLLCESFWEANNMRAYYMR